MKPTKTLDDAVSRLHATRQAKASERLAKQPELFETVSDTPLSPSELAAAAAQLTVKPDQGGKRPALLPARYTNQDFFLCDMFDYALKDDGASMEAPIFTLSTKPDLSVWHWKSKDGNRTVTVTPSVQGRATQFDKDVLIYVVSQMTEALNREREDAKNRTVRFVVYDYLVSTNKPTGGKEYQRLETAFERLRGTSIKTDIKTGSQRVKEGFGIIDSWAVIEKSPDDERMIAVEVTFSKWLFNAVQAHEVLTIHRDYFRLRKPLERRLYELARKHCGQQAMWAIGLDLLREKCGSKMELKAFRRAIKEIIQSDTLPEYHLALEVDKDQVLFHTKNTKNLVASITKRNTPK
jgi:plasmid replication initiation protein